MIDAERQRDRYKLACDQYSEDESLCKLHEVTEQRDRLAEALRWIVVVYATEAEYKQVAQKALAAVKG
jgi:hypothetical protein